MELFFWIKNINNQFLLIIYYFNYKNIESIYMCTNKNEETKNLT